MTHSHDHRRRGGHPRRSWLVGLGLAGLVAGPTVATGYDPAPNEFMPFDTISAEEMNANFQYLVDGISELEARVVPAGAIVPFGGETPPPGWLLCDGSEVDRVAYADLFAAVGIGHGSGDGIVTFNLPDYRGRFLRGTDLGAGRDPNAAQRAAPAAGGNAGDAVGSVQGDLLQSHGHVASQPLLYPGFGVGGPDPFVNSLSLGAVGSLDPVATTAGPPRHGPETRPINAAVHWIIKT